MRTLLLVLAERRKLSVRRILRSLVGVALVSALATTSTQAAKNAQYASPQAAFEQGINALRAGRPDIALPALEHAASQGLFFGEFYLARLFADPTGPFTDHAKAYILYQRLADAHADIDPDDDQRAPFVAKAFTALARYLTRGVPELNVAANPARAAEYLHHAATFFNDKDAQYELAKLYLKGEGVPVDIRQALHWLAVLTEQGHASAQAFLADLYWRGEYVEKSPLRAFALVTVAVENAPAHERIWIEDIYQNIYCGLPDDERESAKGLIQFWRKQYGRAPEIDTIGLSRLQIGPIRTCSNGELVQAPGQPTQTTRTHASATVDSVTTSSFGRTEPEVGAPPAQPNLASGNAPAVVQGNMAGVALREVGDTTPTQ
ncbi:MAG: sel1 repeat family protein [Proteobacteria bacterium]|nr:MAG: sel1 repeat family protein [Pseudomonadota bacterium]